MNADPHPTKREPAGQCFKYHCYARIHTWERNDNDPAPLNGLCREHAERPDRVGTFERPTVVSR